MQNNNNPNSSAPGTFVECIAEKLGSAANVTRLYGEPVERNGVTVIPVSKAMYGFGGGGGTKAGEEGSGDGLMLTPVGYIEIKDGKSRFRTIRNPQTLIRIIAVSRMFTLLTARTITRLFHK